MTPTLYTLIVTENGKAELREITAPVSMMTLDGRAYWLIPVEHAMRKAPPHPAIDPDLRALSASDRINTTARLYKEGVSISDLAERFGITTNGIQWRLRQAGIFGTPNNRHTAVPKEVTARIEEMLLDAGEAGLEPRKLTDDPAIRAAYPHNPPIGPILHGMLQRGLVKRLETKNWAIV